MDIEKRKNRIRGFQKERDLVRKLWEMGFATIRAPASGAKAKKTYQPDIIAAKNNRIFVIEVKTRRATDTVYVDSFQVSKLKEWSSRAGSNARCFIAVYFDRKIGWKFVPLEKAEVTKDGNIKVTKDLASNSLSLDDLNNLTK
ncbi:Holliday junction resolvase [Fervidicoccus fontis]|jgi:Holliday junction resolvase|nr:Holliday junction resolvase Hjc [Fervidicoccus fontis]MBE9390504.1 Holliday junction resolvase [Fervidicoccus fontis]PMB75867.1 MAG: Holliday junction resolvase [Fervidicoccus fontis]PMB77746.1 MAG: Holliday junction resolvase [Fervidicoccus fontis]HEW64288.1 Holliday junction resolvase [Fervidicoccus fontis]